MSVPKQQVLYDAQFVLNRPDQPFVVTVVGDSIIANWKWMDALFFGPNEVNEEVRNYSFTVTLNDNGKWKELDQSEQKSQGVKMSGGTLSFGSSSSSFKGKQIGKSVQFGVGRDNQTGEVGIVGFKYDTSIVKKQVRDYLTNCGWKKAGMFG